MARTQLVRTLAWAPPVVLATLVGLNVLLAALPALLALSTGWVVGAVGEGGAALTVALAVFGFALAADGTAYHALDLANVHAARAIDGRVRREVRRTLGTLPRVDLAQQAELLDDVALATATGGARGFEESIGTGAAGQVVVWFRLVGALLTAAVLIPLSAPLAAALLGVTFLIYRDQQRRWARMAVTESDAVSGVRRTRYWTELASSESHAKELRIFGLGSWVVGRRRAEALGYLLPRWRARTQVLRWSWVGALLFSVGASLAIGYPAWRAATGTIGAEQVVRSIAAGLALLSMGSVWQAFAVERAQVCLAALHRVRAQVANAAPLPTERRSDATEAEDVVLDRVGFAYGNAPPVLHDIDLRLCPGEVVAIVGRNGAGKTTLVRLLAGLHAPTAGRVLLPVSESAWRGQVAVLFADYTRYPLSLRDNVLLGAPDVVDPAGVDRALALAGADDLVGRLPEGADTVLSKEFEGGVDLSGGQWQKVALARAIYAAQHGRRLLIMDEPTAHLDAAVETDFYDRVVRALTGVTVVMISHRLSTVRSADRIVLIDDGRIVEEGTHADLVAADGHYATMFALQASRFAATETSGGGTS